MNELGEKSFHLQINQTSSCIVFPITRVKFDICNVYSIIDMQKTFTDHIKHLVYPFLK